MDGQVTTFDVAISREDGYWVGVVDGLRGGATEARTLAGLEAEIVDLIQGLLDLEEDEVEINRRLDDGIAAVVQEMAAARDQLNHAKTTYETIQKDAVRKLASSKISARDTAKLVGVSHQRVSQLLNA